MKRSDLFAGLAVAAITISGTLTYGATRTWVGGDGSGAQQTQWSRAANWSPSDDFPRDGDTVIIPNVTHQPIYDRTTTDNSFVKLTLNASGADLAFDTSTFMVLTGDMSSGLSLVVTAGATLEISGQDSELRLDSFSDAATVNGTVEVVGTDAIFAVLADATITVGSSGLIDLFGSSPVLKVSADTILTGAGSLRMDSTSAVIEIDANQVLTHNLAGKIFGVGMIHGEAGFPNNGQITIDENRIIEASGGIFMMSSTLVVVDDPSSKLVADNDGTLSFFGDLDLASDFELPDDGNGIFLFNGVDVVTSGDFNCIDGGVRFLNGASFTHSAGKLCQDCNCGGGGLPACSTAQTCP